jgi:hypothetical protein
MFGSSIFDTLLGVVFVFLLVSMLVTIINEMIAAALRSRAKWLRRGIEQLLGSTWAKNLYDHPLVFATARTEKGPSYIPSRSFANVMMDLIRDGNTTLAQARAALQAALATAGTGPGVTVTQLHLALQQAAAAAMAPGANGKPKTGGERLAADIAQLRGTLPTTVGGAITEIQKFIDALPIAHIRESIDNITIDQIRKPLLALYDDAESDVEKFKQNVEIWFNNAMDRVGGWYKRRAQLVTFGIGVVLAVAINVDVIDIARHLHSDPGMREALVAEAAAYARVAPRELVSAKTSPACLAGNPVDEANKPCPPKPGTGADAGQPEDNPEKLEARYRAVYAELNKLSLPIGWGGKPAADTKQQVQPGQPARQDQPGKEIKEAALGFFDEFTNTWTSHLLGWLITALAATLGAPFWFDTLNRLMAIRSAGKSPEEEPKAQKKVPVPLEPGQTPKEADK